jgi:hypothetical protein
MITPSITSLGSGGEDGSLLRRDIMKRLIILLCVLVFIVALPLSHAIAGKGPAPKVDICHATDSAVVNDAGVSLVVGHVINVSENAVAAHLAHGDTLAISGLDDGPGGWFGDMTWGEIADVWGLNTTKANCAGFVLP